MPSTAVWILIIAVTLAIGTLGIAVSGLSWPLAPEHLAPLGLFVLALAAIMSLLIMLVALIGGLRAQHKALATSLEAQSRQLRAVETAQLMERFVHQAEALLAKESLDPNKRSVLRCLAVDALRKNTGRGDPNIARLGRLFEWLANEAEEAKGDATRMRLIEPILRQYAELASQLCQVGECEDERLAAFLRHQPRRLPIEEEG
ncbi:hypothetical protein GCM10007160_12480 [Litchfieldella qijiaojingensis]|uniref:Uncharacterized protein n=1 Tax=Litchfieldella qijiaojingensis TaxID=980347 RepID=A0ABQ2YMK6_9GAMM|nr:hypothetical protein [Halomonas qijiaojingensis]GGX86639.1 hypothetical protein GCM10007160_12480 [Halomonas qijiaojingensis]